MSGRFNQIKDYRQAGKTDYSIHDCFMSGFAMMFFQDSALIEFQRRMQEKFNQNNLKTMFKVSNLPKDTQFREVLDNAPFSEVKKIFADFFRLLQRGKQLEAFRFMDNRYLVPIDGSGYFSSSKIECAGCLKKKSKKGETRYEHHILQAVIVCPGQKQVIPLAPEPITNKDGGKKQDCEINAGKRILKDIRKTHPKLKIIITADGLYSKQPFIDALKKQRMSYILIAKKMDHKVLFNWVDEFKQMKQMSVLEFKDNKDRLHRYEWYNGLPLNGTADADNINFFEYSLFNKGKRTYHNTWVTDIEINRSNVKRLAEGGRAKWKIENETFNTLKNQGYHIEHNYGHGKKNLSNTFFMLNLLAFFMHQIFETADLLYQKCRKKFSARKEYWNQIRCTFRIILFDSWKDMMNLILDPEANSP